MAAPQGFIPGAFTEKNAFFHATDPGIAGSRVQGTLVRIRGHHPVGTSAGRCNGQKTGAAAQIQDRLSWPDIEEACQGQAGRRRGMDPRWNLEIKDPCG